MLYQRLLGFWEGSNSAVLGRRIEVSRGHYRLISMPNPTNGNERIILGVYDIRSDKGYEAQLQKLTAEIGGCLAAHGNVTPIYDKYRAGTKTVQELTATPPAPAGTAVVDLEQYLESALQKKKGPTGQVF